MDRSDVLKKTLVFSQSTDADLKALGPVFRPRTLAAGEVLFRSGELGDYLAVLVSGKLSVEIGGPNKELTRAADLLPYEVVGEMSAIDPAPRSATVTAITHAEVLVLTRTMLDSLRANAAKLFSLVVKGLGQRVTARLRQTNERSTLLAGKVHPRGHGALPGLNSPAPRPYGGPIDLSEHHALRSFDAREREVLKSVAEARLYPAGALLCKEGDPAASCFVISRGKVDILKMIGGRLYHFAELGGGGLLGQMALLDRGQRSATARAQTDVIVLELARDKFEALLAANSLLAIHFQELVTIAGVRQLRLANETLAELSEQGLKGTSSAKPRTVELPVFDDDEDDIEALAAAYINTSLSEWDVTPSEIKNIRVAKVEGVMSQAELNARLKK